MDPAARSALGASFERGAAGYAAHRPGYPAAAIPWLAGEPPADVLDLGAGTGSLTAALAAVGHRVVAAEPSLSMLHELRRKVEGAAAVRSAAESLPFRADCFDVVTAATAFHWFDPARALPAIADVLRPGGRLSLVYNTQDESVEWVVS